MLADADRPELARSIPTLQIHGRCPCSDLACASFYTASWRDDALSLWARIWTTIPLPAARGEVNVDIANEQIVAVEVLGRRDFWAALTRQAAVPDASPATDSEVMRTRPPANS